MPKPKTFEVVSTECVLQSLKCHENNWRDKTETYFWWLQDLIPSLNHSRFSLICFKFWVPCTFFLTGKDSDNKQIKSHYITGFLFTHFRGTGKYEKDMRIRIQQQNNELWTERILESNPFPLSLSQEGQRQRVW